MMKMAAIATKKTKQSSSTAKAYLKSLARDLAKNARDYKFQRKNQKKFL